MTSDNQHSEHLEPSAPSGGDDLMMEQQQLLAEQETTPGTPGAAVANGRGYMVKKGSPGQPACHVFPEELRKKVSHEFADKWSEEEQRQLARLVGSPANLFVQTTEDNKLHRKYEEELNRSLAGGSDLSARAARRAVRMLDLIVEDASSSKHLSERVARNILEYVNTATYNGSSLLAYYYEQRQVKLAEDPVATRLVGATAPAGTLPVDVETRGAPRRAQQRAILLRKDGRVSKQSPAVKSGQIKLKKDGNVSKNSPMVRDGTVKVRKDGTIHKGSRAHKDGLVAALDAPSSAPTAESASAAAAVEPTATKPEARAQQSTVRLRNDGRVSKQSPAVKSGQIQLKKDGNVSKRSPMVRDGTVKLKKDGTVDRRSRAFRSSRVATPTPAAAPAPAASSSPVDDSASSSFSSASSTSSYSSSFSSSSSSSSSGNPWNDFQRAHGGQGYSRSEMSAMYRASRS